MSFRPYQQLRLFDTTRFFKLSLETLVAQLIFETHLIRVFLNFKRIHLISETFKVRFEFNIGARDLELAGTKYDMKWSSLSTQLHIRLQIFIFVVLSCLYF